MADAGIQFILLMLSYIQYVASSKSCQAVCKIMEKDILIHVSFYHLVEDT